MYVEHSIPQLGHVRLQLYPPADALYRRLHKIREISRLNRLRHLGAIDRAFPGIRHARWDYTVAMLYYANRLRVPGMNSKFKIERVQFSSAISALQSAALIWNVGHLPGTFGVEKAVYRFITTRQPLRPSACLALDGIEQERASDISRLSDAFMDRQDYLALPRVLAAIKLARAVSDTSDELHPFVDRFAIPFLLEADSGLPHQWNKIRKAFLVIRHLAYLTMDSPYAGLEWAPNVPALLRQLVSDKEATLESIVAGISEALSPLEKAIYTSLYHSSRARLEIAAISGAVTSKLERSSDPGQLIKQWTAAGLMTDLSLGSRIRARDLDSSGCITLRSHFTSLGTDATQLELELRKAGFAYAVALRYLAWNSDVVLEPDELIVDAIREDVTESKHVGALILWLMFRYEDLGADRDDTFEMLRKNDLERNYLALFDRAFSIRYPQLRIYAEPWPLTSYGLLGGGSLQDGRGAVWASNAKIDTPIANHLLRDRTAQVPRRLRERYGELLGVRALRVHLRREWRKKRELRQRWLILTSSVRLYSGGKEVLEFDGGLLKLSTRGGRLTWLGLESKLGRECPKRSLERRLAAAGLDATVTKLSPKYAFAEMPL